MLVPNPSSNYDDYRACILEQLELSPDQWTFKSDKRYQRILEHVSKGEAEGFWHNITTEFPNIPVREALCEIAEDNDKYGKPHIITVDDITVGASNFQYLYHGLKLWQYIDSLNLPAIHVIELGAGFGGQVVHFTHLSWHFSTSLIGYTMIDLPEAAQLQQQYVDALSIPAIAYSGLDLNSYHRYLWNEPRIVFSAYGFSEFDPSTQRWYEERLIKHCEYGFFVWNYAPNWPHRPPNDIYDVAGRKVRIESGVQSFTTDDISYVYF